VPVALFLGFAAGAAVSLSTSWLLVTRLERIGERLGLTEGLLGVIAALAADAPEVTSAVTALVHHQQHVGAGVVIGSNAFNLAALLGLSAIVAGRIRLHRRVVVLGGVVGSWVATVCLLTVTGGVGALAGLLLCLLALVPYLILLGAGRARLARTALAPRWERWLAIAVVEEEMELTTAIRPQRGRPLDAAVACLALLVVVGASVVMEQTASALGSRYHVPQIVTGGITLAAVTSLPNAVAAVYLAARGRGAATLSITLNSNALNVLAGLLIPGALIGLGPPASQITQIAVWYLALTAGSLVLAYHGRGLRRSSGTAIVLGYLAFVAWLLVTSAIP
jgi:cation:H+ antiporter